MVGRGGLEPPTSRLSGVRSNHLSYRPAVQAARQALRAHADPLAEAHGAVFPCMKGYEDGLADVECTFDGIWGSD